MKKIIFVSGGVCSSIGKGLLASSIGAVLELHDYKISMMKVDPYFNVDAGTMNPYQHGEVYVTDDGAETDLDIGNYYRFTHADLGKDNLITTGKIYQELISKEREGKYLGATVQMIPHATNIIKSKILNIANNCDILIVEIGGTVGDYESIPFLEVARQIIMENKANEKDSIMVHLTLVPQLLNGELKTKPTQHSVKQLRQEGIQPDMLVCRAPIELDNKIKEKISTFTNVVADNVISNENLTHIYAMPLTLKRQNVDVKLLNLLGLKAKENIEVNFWKGAVDILSAKDMQVLNIAVVGKYIGNEDNYKSVYESLVHASIKNKVKLNMININSELEAEIDKISNLNLDGILVPGGFGERGVLGMINAIKFARENRIPMFGICLGMQVMCIEFARNVLGFEKADSTEWATNTPYPVISLLEEQKPISSLGGSMRLGGYDMKIKENTKLHRIYNSLNTRERHRHRYEVNSEYIEEFELNGFLVSAYTKSLDLVESMEYTSHWGVGVQYHPELLSRITDPHPIFVSFLENALLYAKTKQNL